MQIEYVARISLTSWRTVKQKGKCTVSYRVLGQIIVNDQNVLALVHEEFTDRAARVRCNVLQRCRLGCGCGYDAGIIHRAVGSERLCDLCNGRTLLTDCYIDTNNAGALLIDDGVQTDRGLAGLTVTDDQLTLTAADRDHGVDRLDTGLERHINGCALDDARCGHFDRTALLGLDGALAVDRLAECVYNTSQHGFADRDLYDSLGALYRVTLADVLIRAEDNRADQLFLQVLRHALHAARKFEQLACHAVFKAMDMRDTVTDGNNRAHVGQLDLALIMRDLLLDNAADLFGAQFHKNHLLSCVPVNRAASSSRRVRRLVSNCSLLTFTTMPPMMLGSTEHFSSTFLPVTCSILPRSLSVSAALIGTAVTASTSTMPFSK